MLDAHDIAARKTQLQQFLDTVLPVTTDGYGLVSAIRYPDATKPAGYGWRHRVWKDTAALAVDLFANDGRVESPVYFALSSFPITEGYGKWTSRKASAAHSIRAMWLDVDALSDAARADTSKDAHSVQATGKYFTKADALAALVAFVKVTGLPVPLVVDSGNGLHLYWPFEESAVPVDENWYMAARRLAAMCKHHGFYADPSRTFDAASVLRPVGTTHCKPDSVARRIVSVVHAGDGRIAAADMFTRIQQHTQANGIVTDARKMPSAGDPNVSKALRALPQAARDALMTLQTGSADGHDRTAELEPIRSTCAQLTGFGDVPYDSRLLAASVVSHCRGGRDAYIQESLNCPTLRANGTVKDDADIIAKASESYDRWLDEGLTPAYCAAWQGSSTADKCEGCEYKGRPDFTPIALGMGKAKQKVQAQIAAAERPVELVTTPAGDKLQLMPLPSGYRERNGQMEFMKTNDEGEAFWLPMLKGGTLRMVHVLEESSRTGPTSKFVFSRVMVHDKTRAGDLVEFTPRQISRKPEMLDRLLDMQLSPEDDNAMAKYMRATLSPDVGEIPVHTVLPHYGWLTKDDMDTRVGPNAPIRTASPVAYDSAMSTRFVLHDRCYYPGGSTRIFYTAQAESTAVSRGVRAEGDLATWLRAPAVLVRNQQHAALFCVALSFGAALMEFAPAGTANPIVNFWAPESGTGKSTALRIANSVWAHPDRAMAQADDSAAARSLYMPDFYSLPVSVDEITNVRDEELSKFVFAAARGVERATATRDRSSREPRRWRSVILATANNTVAQKIAEFSKDRPGEQMRAIDVRMSYPVSARGRTADHADLAVLDHNYGLAGEVFIERLLADIPRMRAAVATLVERATKGVPSYTPLDGERFWSTALAAAVTAAELAKEYGLVDFDVPALQQFAVDAIESQRELQHEVCGVDGRAIVDAFMTANLGTSILRVQSNNPDVAVPPNKAAEGGFVMDPEPQRDAIARYEVQQSRLVVLGTAFDEFCKRYGHQPRVVLDDLYKRGMLHSEHQPRKSGGIGKLRYPMLAGWHLCPAESEKEKNRPRRMSCYVIDSIAE